MSIMVFSKYLKFVIEGILTCVHFRCFFYDYGGASAIPTLQTDAIVSKIAVICEVTYAVLV